MIGLTAAQMICCVLSKTPPQPRPSLVQLTKTWAGSARLRARGYCLVRVSRAQPNFGHRSVKGSDLIKAGWGHLVGGAGSHKQAKESGTLYFGCSKFSVFLSEGTIFIHLKTKMVTVEQEILKGSFYQKISKTALLTIAWLFYWMNKVWPKTMLGTSRKIYKESIPVANCWP